MASSDAKLKSQDGDNRKKNKLKCFTDIFSSIDDRLILSFTESTPFSKMTLYTRTLTCMLFKPNRNWHFDFCVYKEL